jgi:hypothetical protein
MDLYGKLIFREDEFNQQREGPTIAEASAPPFGGHGGPNIAKFLASVGAACETGLIASHPSLADRLSEIGHCREKRLQ